jgi:signal peptidase I
MRRLVAAGLLGLVVGCGSDEGADQVDTELRMPSESMLPTYAVGDVLKVDLEPESVGRGDVVILFPPQGAETASCGVQHSERSACPRPTPARSEVRFVKRIVGKPGDRLKILGAAVYISGRRKDEPYARLDDGCPICNLPEDITIPADHLFVMGDNRPASSDSREWGPVPSRWIVGKVVGVEAGPKIE